MEQDERKEHVTELQEQYDRLVRQEAAMRLEKEFIEAVAATVREGLLVLDADLTVQYANHSFLTMFRVDPAETIGYPVYRLGNGQWDIPALRTLLEEVLPQDRSFHDFEVEHYFEAVGRRIMFLSGARIEEVGLILLAIEDVTDRIDLQREVYLARQFSGKVIDTVREGLLVLTPELRVQTANLSFYNTFKVAPEETIGRSVYELGNGQWNIPALHRLLEDVLPDNDAFNDYEVVHEFEHIGTCVMRLNARRVDSIQMILLAIEDLTKRSEALATLKLREQQLRELNETLEAQVEERMRQVRELSSQLAVAEREERRRISQLLHDDLQQRLYSMQVQMAMLQQLAREGDAESIQAEMAAIEAALRESVVVTRHLSIDLSPPILEGEGLTDALSWLASQMQEKHHLIVQVVADDSFPIADEGLLTMLFQMVRELLFNIVKHAGVPQARVSLSRQNGYILLKVEDDGQGFDPARVSNGSIEGMGLARIRHQTQLLNGEMSVASAPGQGTRITILAPSGFALGSEPHSLTA